VPLSGFTGCFTFIKGTSRPRTESIFASRLRLLNVTFYLYCFIVITRKNNVNVKELTGQKREWQAKGRSCDLVAQPMPRFKAVKRPANVLSLAVSMDESDPDCFAMVTMEFSEVAK